jgi:hypothetical protein
MNFLFKSATGAVLPSLRRDSKPFCQGYRQIDFRPIIERHYVRSRVAADALERIPCPFLPLSSLTLDIRRQRTG